jgi:hypothetical protein
LVIHHEDRIAIEDQDARDAPILSWTRTFATDGAEIGTGRVEYRDDPI